MAKPPWVRKELSGLLKVGISYQQSKKSPLFWMDTLCIPATNEPGDTEAWRLKKKSINGMASIYGRASRVLVLDSGLSACRLAVMKPCEVLLNIAFCNWIGRSWTLQEAGLNLSVFFQFADGAYNFLDVGPSTISSEIYTARFRRFGILDSLKSWVWANDHAAAEPSMSRDMKIKRRGEIWLHRQLHDECCRTVHHSDLGQLQGVGGIYPDIIWAHRVVHVWNSLATRTTTQEEDVPAIFSNLLGLDTGKILDLPSDRRLGAIILSGPILPFSLFCTNVPRIKSPCAEQYTGRWIPARVSREFLWGVPMISVLERGKRLLLPVRDKVDITSEILGLHAIVPRDPVRMGKEVHLVDAKAGTKMTIICQREADDKLANASGHYAFVILDFHNYRRTSRDPYLGCSLRIHSPKHLTEIDAIYDCPCICVPGELTPSDENGEPARIAADMLSNCDIPIAGDPEQPVPTVYTPPELSSREVQRLKQYQDLLRARILQT
ncbi:hypothetical protein M011DRAFT_476361 [Sporormia fimetaria CBS 119925]|uniref:Heterokaryon incompatibility domain-containing protein n=1 Tax=Sporormia fimetaria CBS 119925 TaxID=1340428 RepID=A0A6A6VDR5_9PLEO|nr:hypothetical protein M011DRAFT_476361 [Sporormia fimetaria CBS 119925]